MNKILVTGANGFIGKTIVSLLKEKGYEVFITSHTKDTIDGLNVYYIDLLDPCSKIQAMIETIRPNYLIHLAWEVKPNIYWTSPQNLSWVSSTIELFKQFYSFGGTRGILAGTSAEYMWNQDTPYDEITSYSRPQTLYGECKLNCAEIISRYCSIYNKSFAWGRIFFAYGEGENQERLIPSMIRTLKNDEVFEFVNSHLSGDFIYIEDVASAFVSILESKIQGPVNIGNGESIALSDMLSNIARKISRTYLLNIKYNSKLESMSANITRLRSTGWQPRYSLEQGIDKTIEWYNK